MSITSTSFALLVGGIAFILLAIGVLITISDLKKRHEHEAK
jgi:hypothetical protein